MKEPMKKLVLCVLILSTFVCYGCELYIYTFQTNRTGTIDPSFIKVGVTTKEDVVLRCGYPSSAVSNDERVYTYSWTTSKYTRLESRTLVDSIESYTTYLQIYFDENNFVKNYTLDEKKKE
jgi:outer membrane protein assembly factor BamE (lipoprotein component of BamABCDE complex)